MPLSVPDLINMFHFLDANNKFVYLFIRGLSSQIGKVLIESHHHRIQITHTLCRLPLKLVLIWLVALHDEITCRTGVNNISARV